MDPRILRSVRRGAVALALLGTVACTVKKQETPDLAGPSEFGLSVSVAVSPDVLTQDGASQSTVTVSAHDANGAPARNVSLRAAINVGGVNADFGSLSARNMLTGADGRATAVYTAPMAPAVTSDDGTMVSIVVTPVGNDYANSHSSVATIRLVPPGRVVPPSGLTPSFTVSPSAPIDSQPVLFDGTASTAGPGNAIASYSWNFGDGGRGSGATASHVYDAAGTYVVTLTITDSVGRSAQKSQTISVGAGTGPSAAFSVSPTDSLVNQPVNFNASASAATPGRTIVSYEWDFGDGVFGTGRVASHAYGLARSYVVTLTVKDDSGKKATATQTVVVKNPS